MKMRFQSHEKHEILKPVEVFGAETLIFIMISFSPKALIGLVKKLCLISTHSTIIDPFHWKNGWRFNICPVKQAILDQKLRA